MRGDWLRWGLWLGLLATADANRRHFGLPTTWVIHLTGNSVALLLPELYAGLSRLLSLDERATRTGSLAAALHRALCQVVCANPQYSAYVAPLTLGYLVSHPSFNIYKGRLGALRLAGFGLDTIPHTWTAAALTTGLLDGLAALVDHAPPASRAGAAARWAGLHAVALSGVTLALLTTIYETGEWLIYREEWRATGGDHARMNMEWSLPDSRRDVVANMAGWLVGVALHRRVRPVTGGVRTIRWPYRRPIGAARSCRWR